MDIKEKLNPILVSAYEIDGYLVNPAVFLHAQKLLDDLNSLHNNCLPEPELSAHPDGCITMEWYKSSKQILSLDIDSQATVYYAAFFKKHSFKGVFNSKSMPNKLADILRVIKAVYVNLDNYWIEFCDHCQRNIVAHNCPLNLGTCSGGVGCPDCDGGHILEDLGLENLTKIYHESN